MWSRESRALSLRETPELDHRMAKSTEMTNSWVRGRETREKDRPIRVMGRYITDGIEMKESISTNQTGIAKYPEPFGYSEQRRTDSSRDSVSRALNFTRCVARAGQGRDRVATLFNNKEMI